MSARHDQIRSSRPPDIRIGGLKVWCYGREFDFSTDYWDGNWLMSVVDCEADGVRVSAAGPILHLDQFVGWLGRLRRVMELGGEAPLGDLEPGLEAIVSLRGESGEVMVDVSPSDQAPATRFEFSIRRENVIRLVAQIEQLCRVYSHRGER